MCFEPICTNLKEINISMVLKIMQWWLNSVFTLFRILWKSKCHVLVTFPIQLKKLCSIYTLEHRIELWIFSLVKLEKWTHQKTIFLVNILWISTYHKKICSNAYALHGSSQSHSSFKHTITSITIYDFQKNDATNR